MWLFRLFKVLFLVPCFAGCGVVGGMNGNLTPAKAKELVGSAVFLPGEVITLPVVAPHEACVQEGFCHEVVGNLTEEGRRHFSRLPPAHGMPGTIRLTPAKPVLRVVLEVTGITAGEDRRVAEFTWRYSGEGFTDPVKRYSGQGSVIHSGGVVLQRYSDGWRVAMLDFFDGRGPRPNVIFNETPPGPFSYDSALLEKWRIFERARLESTAAAKTPTRTIASYEFNGISPAGPVQYFLDIKDNGFSLRVVGAMWAKNIPYISYGDCRRPSRNPYQKNKIVFGCRWVQEGRKTVGDFWVEGGNDEPVDTAFEQFLQAYDDWRAKHPELITEHSKKLR